MRAGAAAAGLRARADDGGEPAPRAAAVARRSDRCSCTRPISAGLLIAAVAARSCVIALPNIRKQARGSVPGRDVSAPMIDGDDRATVRDSLPASTGRCRTRRGASRSSRATSSRRRSRSPRRRASRCSRAAATPSTRRSRPRSRSPSSSPAATASAPTSSRSCGTAASSSVSMPRAARRPRGRRSASRAARRCRERGWETVTIPGAVSGWVALSQRYGKLPFADLFEPAIRYARDGYRGVADRRREMGARRAAHAAGPRLAGALPAARPRAAAGRALRVAPRWRARSRRSRARDGEAFYRGELAAGDGRAFAARTAARTRASDFAAHTADWVTPLAHRLPRRAPCTRSRRTARASPR